MKPQRIYIETTIFNRYFDTEYKNEHEASRQLFTEIKAGKFDAYTSKYTYDELSDAPEPKRSNMLDLIDEYKIKVLGDTDEILALAKDYIAKGVIPKSSVYDARHIACASINGIEHIISLNFSHINRLKTKEQVPAVNKLNGYNGEITINTPMEIIEVKGDK